ncbi:molybdopterin-dependent oxidoreductase [uncultured Ferrimonas sp.]|uniref:molybdopterin-dependent oxidoreductase n=1 Tax=uncultured Ferrimonas sp. TaxID=432640 RepID=UPI002617DBEB|nr:molybdopterin-dependent oxidoreductase [uncultured Ferrimonas sp.]
MDRRQFLKAGSVAAISAAGAAKATEADAPISDDALAKFAPTSLKPEFQLDGNALNPVAGQRFAFSKCYGCFNVCGARVSIDENTDQVVRAWGNPYMLTSNTEPFDMSVPPKEALYRLAATREYNQDNAATLCGRGNAVLDAFNNKHRITQCLKRVGKRGDNKWATIPYEQLLKEVTEGGNLFGEGHVDGLKAIHANPNLANPSYPDFGPVKNQLLVSTSTEQANRWDFMHRFTHSAWGTPNVGNKDSYCGHQQVAGWGLGCFDAVTESALPTTDFEHCKFAIFIGTNPGLSGNSLNSSSRRIAKARAERGDFKYVVVDPLLRSLTSETSANNSEWVPIRSGGDTALLFGMLQYIINHQRYRQAYLAAPSQAAADKQGEVNYTNASYLVVKQPGHPLHNRFLTAEAMGLGSQEVKMVQRASDGKLVSSDSDQQASLYYQGAVQLADGSKVKVATAFALLKQRVNEHSLAQYAEHSGVPAAKIEELAKEFTSYGRQVAIETNTGCNATDGGQCTYAQAMLATMVGAHNAKGGLNHMTGVGFGLMYDIFDGPLYKLNDFQHVAPEGFNAERSGDYEQSQEYKAKLARGENPYPANQPWNNTFVQENSGEMLVAHANANPFQFKAWFIWSTNPIYNCSGLEDQVVDSIADPKQLGLIIGIDPYINETNVYADYLVPDLLQYEQWMYSRMWGSEYVGDVASVSVIEPKTVKDANGNPVCMEQFIIDVSKTLSLPGFGDSAFADAKGRRYGLHVPQDLYVPLFANAAHSGEVLPSPTQEDIQFTSVDRIQGEFAQRLKPEELGPTLFMLTRGGRYERLEQRYDGDFLNPAIRMDVQFQIYNEALAQVKDSYSGEYLDGQPVFDVDRFWDGSAVRDRWSTKKYPFSFSTFKPQLRNAYSAQLPRLTALGEANFIQMHAEDAAKYGLKTGERAQLLSPKGTTLEGVVQADNTVAKGTISVGIGYGHSQFGAQSITIDDTVIAGQPERAGGINPNPFNVVDPTRKGASLYRDRTFGSTCRHGVPVGIRKV